MNNNNPTYFQSPDKSGRDAAETERPAAESVISRRRFLKLMGITASALAVKGIDYGSGDLLWRRDRTEIGFAYQQNSLKNSPAAWLVLGGYNVYDSRPIAGALAPSLGKTGPVAYLNYAENGLSTGEIGQSILNFTERQKISELNFYLHSMAGAVFVDTYTKIKPELALRNIAINNLLLDGSPYNLYDVKGDKRQAAELVARLSGWWDNPGVISKFSSEAINKVVERLNRETAFTPWQMIQQAAKNAVGGASPRTSQDQLKLLYELPMYEGLLSRASRPCFIGPSNPDDDKTVDRDLAIADWKKASGGNLEVILLDNIHHADPVRFAAKYNQAISYYLWRQTNNPQRNLS